ARSGHVCDDQTVDAFGRAAEACARQIETHDQLAAMRERIYARLELVRAALASFLATVVKLQVSGEEQRIPSGDSAVPHLDGAGSELEVLETALALDLAA